MVFFAYMVKTEDGNFYDKKIAKKITPAKKLVNEL